MTGAYSIQQTTTTTTTISTTLTGDACYTKPQVPGGYTVSAEDPRQTILRYDDYRSTDPYHCCSTCYIQLQGGDCVAWAYVPGVSCTVIFAPFIYRAPGRCPGSGFTNGTIAYNEAKYPNALGGYGPCAGTVTLKQG